MSDISIPPPKKTGRTFLVVVDDTPEMRAALIYACRRARNTGGRVALLRVVEPATFAHFATIGALMREEARQDAEQLMMRLAAEVNDLSGDLPVLYVREGNIRDELLTLINEEPSISILVLAADTGSKGPGPLVSALTSRYVNKLRIPLTIVPGNLSPEELAQIT